MHPARFADVLDQAAAVLDAAHALGVVHRDLKPSSLMLTEGPRGSMIVKLADLGIAEAVGSPGYMSPEQIDGTSEIGSRTDLWALGVVAYEAITGQDCFRGATTMQLSGAIRAARFDQPSSVHRELPRALDAWFARAIALQPSDRFPSAGAMARAFRVALGSDSTPRAPLFAASVVVVLLSVAVAGLAVYRERSASPRAPVGAVSAASVPVPAPAPAPAPSAAATDTAIPPMTASAPAEAPSARTVGTAHASDRSRAPTAHVSGGAAPAPAHRAPDEQVPQAPENVPPEKAPLGKAVDPSEYQ